MGAPRCVMYSHTHTLTVHTHTLYHPHVTRAHPALCGDPLSTHAQTFTQVPPGFDGWSVSALPPVSYTYNLIWGPHGGRGTKTGLIEAVKLSYPSPSRSSLSPVKSYPLCFAKCVCSLLIKSRILWTKNGKAFGCIIYPRQSLMCLMQSGDLGAF